jgi:amino acid adenylation domain-containing protein
MLSSMLVELAKRAETDRDRTLLVDGPDRLSFGEVWRRALALGAWLRGAGVAPGDRVGVLMGRSHEQAVAHLGAMAAHGVFVPISDLLRAGQVQYIVGDCGIRHVIVDQDKVDRLGDLASGLKLMVVGPDTGPHASFRAAVQVGAAEPCPRIVGQDSAAIIYSSGSTGMPKGIVLSHRNLWDGARIISHYLGLQRDDRLAQVLSLNFDYGLNQLFDSILVGCELHFHTFHFPKDLFAFLRDSEITTLALMPVFLNRIFDPRFFKTSFTEGVTALRRITTTGGRMPLPTVQAIRQAFPRTDLYLMFGLTEAFRSTYLDPSQVDRRPDSIGKAIPDAQIMVLDDEGKECLPGVPGELVHRGGVISKGYWNAPEKTRERFRPWMDPSGNVETVVYSGDLVRRDDEGYLYFLGRRDNMIKTSGHRVSPEEIERCAEAMPGVQDAVAFAREHPVLGEEIVMICTRNEAAGKVDDVQLKAWIRERLASYMVPQVVLFHDDFGVTAGNQGKIDRTTAKRVALELLTAR